MKIILVRHAKAEHAYGKTDRERKLTPEGIREFEPKVQALAEKLDGEENVVIWSSPAIRAQESADIIVENLQASPVRDVEQSIYFGDFEDLFPKLELLDSATTLIIIGHQPSLSYWSGYLSGNSVPYSSGDMACFEVISLEPIQAELVWTIS
ncbi:MAG: SixA phosphatase family protein [Saccharofermentanales bacterium]|jgi:phosphohistidine phosphatase